MPIYNVDVTATYQYEIEAKDEEEAGDKAIALVKEDPSFLLDNAETDVYLVEEDDHVV